MTDDILARLRDILDDRLAPLSADVRDATRASTEARAEIVALRTDINGGEGRPGLKERLATMEATCKVRHGPENTQQREAVSAELAQSRLARIHADTRSMPPTSKTHLAMAKWKVVSAAITALGMAAAAYYAGREGAPSTTPAHAAPAHASPAP